MKIRVEVVYALPDAQGVIEVVLEEGARVAEAVAASRLAETLPGALLAGHRLGIWGIPATPETALRDRDRVEIYRELTADPKQARRNRAGRRSAKKR